MKRSGSVVCLAGQARATATRFRTSWQRPLTAKQEVQRVESRIYSSLSHTREGMTEGEDEGVALGRRMGVCVRYVVWGLAECC